MIACALAGAPSTNSPLVGVQLCLQCQVIFPGRSADGDMRFPPFGRGLS